MGRITVVINSSDDQRLFIGCLIPDTASKHFKCINLFNPHRNPLRWCCHYSPSTEDKTEAQRLNASEDKTTLGNQDNVLPEHSHKHLGNYVEA
jgi:hypothetical protein